MSNPKTMSVHNVTVDGNLLYCDKKPKDSYSSPVGPLSARTKRNHIPMDDTPSNTYLLPAEGDWIDRVQTNAQFGFTGCGALNTIPRQTMNWLAFKASKYGDARVGDTVREERLDIKLQIWCNMDAVVYASSSYEMGRKFRVCVIRENFSTRGPGVAGISDHPDVYDVFEQGMWANVVAPPNNKFNSTFFYNWANRKRFTFLHDHVYEVKPNFFLVPNGVATGQYTYMHTSNSININLSFDLDRVITFGIRAGGTEVTDPYGAYILNGDGIYLYICPFPEDEYFDSKSRTEIRMSTAMYYQDP